MMNDFEKEENGAVDNGEPLDKKDMSTQKENGTPRQSGEKSERGSEDINAEPSSEMPEAESREKEDAVAVMEDNKIDTSENTKKNAREVYAFRWNYYDQYIYDKSESRSAEIKVAKKSDVKGALIFIVIMLLSFSLAFSVLFTALKFDDMAKWFADSTDTKMSIEQIVEKGMPSSVAIFGMMGTNTYSAGSGVVVNSLGYIVTNYHVVENSYSIRVLSSGGAQYSASVVGYDEAADFAVLYVENCSLPAAMIGDSSTLKLGETVVSIGTPGNEECAFSVTDGIVSGLNRRVSGNTLGMIQTNAPLNPGNSGGPLFDENGNVVGLVTMKYTFTNFQENGQYMPYEGMSFAIPINAICERVEKIINDDLGTPMIGIYGVAVKQGQTYFLNGEKGIIYDYQKTEDGEYYFDSNGTKYPLTEDLLESDKNMVLYATSDGIAVMDVMHGLGAYGKLQRGDIIYMINDVEISSQTDLKSVLNKIKIGQTLNVKVYREGISKSIDIKIVSKE